MSEAFHDLDGAITAQDLRVSLVIGSVIRARARVSEAEKALRRALDQAVIHGVSARDIDTAERFSGPEQSAADAQRAGALLAATGANVVIETVEADPKREDVEIDNERTEIKRLLWRQGWFAAVWNRPLDLSRWSDPDLKWKGDTVLQGFTAFSRAMKTADTVLDRKPRVRPAVAA